MSFGVESITPSTLKKVGRRPIPEAHQRAVIDACRQLGIVTAAFYVIGFMEDTWESINATIDYSRSLGSTVAQFKILTPYPGTPLFKRMQPAITETNWERFDGFTPTAVSIVVHRVTATNLAIKIGEQPRSSEAAPSPPASPTGRTPRL